MPESRVVAKLRTHGIPVTHYGVVGPTLWVEIETAAGPSRIEASWTVCQTPDAMTDVLLSQARARGSAEAQAPGAQPPDQRAESAPRAVNQDDPA